MAFRTTKCLALVALAWLALLEACSSAGFTGNSDHSKPSPAPVQNSTDKASSKKPSTVDPTTIPGVEVEKIGLEFEDWTDFDYDVHLCFEGYFKVDGNSIVSFKDQTVTATSKAKGECDHRIDVVITHADGTSSADSYPSKNTTQVPMNLRIGSRMDITLTPISGYLCTQAGTLNVPITINDQRGRVTLGQCR